MWKMAAVGLSSLSRSRIVPALAVYSIFWPLIVTVCLLSTSFSFGSPALDLSLSGSPAALSAGFSAECSGGLSSVLAGASAAERLAGTAEAARATANRSILNMRGCCRPLPANTNQNSRTTTADSTISRKERGQPCPRVSTASPQYRADKAVRAPACITRGRTTWKGRESDAFGHTRFWPPIEISGVARVLEIQNILQSSQVLNRQWTRIHAKD